MKMRKLLVLSPLILLIIGFVGMRLLSSFKEEKPKRTSQIRPRSVQTEVVTLGDVSAQFSTYGTLASSQPVTLIAEVSGTLKSGNIPFQPAQSFKKGDLLLKVDDRQIRLQLNSTKSDLLTALATLMPEIKVSTPEIFQTWQSYFDSIKFDKAIGPLPGADDQRLKALLARYNIYKLYFAVQDLEIRASKHYFYAPFNGSIVSTNLRVGSTAAPGTRLAEIINLDELEVEIQIPAQDIAWIQPGATVDLSTNDGEIHWDGHVDRVGNTIDERSQAILAYIKLDDTGQNHPYAGVFLKAVIDAQVIPNSVEVPRRAVYEDRYVFTVKNDLFVRQEVDITFDEGDAFIIGGGLNAGDTLVTELLQGVSAGMPAKAILSSTDEG